MAERIDDGRRRMPKLKCPYGNHRVADVVDVMLRNDSELVKLAEASIIDYILECPHCHQKVGLYIIPLHQSIGATKDCSGSRYNAMATSRGKKIPSSRQ